MLRSISIPCIGLSLFCLFIWLPGCATSHEDHIFFYDAARVEKYLHKHGMSAESQIYRSWQDANGTRIYFQQDSMTGPVWVVSARRHSPHLVEFQNGDGWLDEKDQFRPLPAYARNAALTCEVDEQSGYFFQGNRQAGLLYIGSCNDPSGYLVQCTTDWTTFWPDQICISGDTIILLQIRDLNRRNWFQHFNNCWIFRKSNVKPHEWIKEERRLDATIVCADPFARRLLCQSYGSVPLPSSLLFYDVDSGSIANVGPQVTSRYAFILRTNVLAGESLCDPSKELPSERKLGTPG